jgi:hypothetical protein
MLMPCGAVPPAVFVLSASREKAGETPALQNLTIATKLPVARFALNA